MISILKEHNIHEVWNEHTCESVFIEGKPSKQTLIDIVKKEEWMDDFTNNFEDISEYIKEYIHVNKVRIYTTSTI